VAQILRSTATAPARDRRIFSLKSCFFAIKSPKRDTNFSFFSTRNQYFPHIPYVASKKEKITLEYFGENFDQYTCSKMNTFG
jgi:hypothetical protein